MLLLKLAARNLGRNIRRTVITMTGISLGLALMLVSNNMSYGSYQDMLRTAVGLLAGHVVVQGQGYQDDPDSETVVTNSRAVADAIRAAVPDATVTRRLNIDGLVVSPVASTSASVRAVEPSTEALVIDLDDKVVDGEWLADDDDMGILLGKALADRLKVGLGDKVVYMGQPSGDEVESRLFRVRGIFRTGSPDIDAFTALVHIDAAQELYDAADPATQVAVHLPDDRRVPERTEQVLAAVASVADTGATEVLPWQQAIPEIVEFIQLDKRYANGIWLVLGVIVAMGVVNTVLMSVLERVREFGVMMAVGLRPARLARMVMLEGLLLGAVSAAIGIGIGLLATWPLMSIGIDFSGAYGETMEAGGIPVNMIIYPEIDWERLFIYPVVGVLFALLASVYPAWKVTRLEPIQAIRHQ